MIVVLPSQYEENDLFSTRQAVPVISLYTYTTFIYQEPKLPLNFLTISTYVFFHFETNNMFMCMYVCWVCSFVSYVYCMYVRY